jgi:hypothetical protein
VLAHPTDDSPKYGNLGLFAVLRANLELCFRLTAGGRARLAQLGEGCRDVVG